MKILLIGNSGFIGSCLTKHLIETGYEVVGLDLNQPISKEKITNFFQGDILNKMDVERAAIGVDLIINLAAKHHDFGVSKEEFFNVNVNGTKNILDCAEKKGINKVIFYSTVAVYGDVPNCSQEITPTNPVSDYGRSKLAAERIINEWAAKDTGRQVTIIRPTVVFGPNNYANMYNLINSINRKRFILVGKGENIKSVAYVENLADATVYLLKKIKSGVEVYNYSDYPQLTSKQIVSMIALYLGIKMPPFTLPLTPTVIAASCLDLLGKVTGYNFPITAKRIKKFNTTTCHNSDKIRYHGFRPSIELTDGFRKMVEWYLQNRRCQGNGRRVERAED